MPGMTIVEHAKGSDPLTRAFVRIFAESSEILRVLPMVNVTGGGYRYNVEQTLPGVGFRGVNEAWTPSTGVINPMFEPLVIAGGELDFDLHLLRTQGEARRNQEDAAKVRALSLKIAQVVVKGDATSEPRQFDGLQVRLAGPQLIKAGTTAGGTALALTTLDEGIDAVEDPTHILSNKSIRRHLSAAARDPAVAGYVTYSVDQFGRRVIEYGGIPWIALDKDNLYQEILPFSEAADNGGATATSVYVVSMRPGRVYGIQSGPIIVRDLGELDEKPAMRTRVEWDVGMVVEHPFAAARIWSVGDLAFTA